MEFHGKSIGLGLGLLVACHRGQGDGSGSGSGTGSGSGESSGSATAEESGDGDGDVPPCPYVALDGNPAFILEELSAGFSAPLFVAGHPTQPDRLFVVEQGGAIKVLEPDAMEAPMENFHVEEVNMTAGEMGLLGFAFHPDFPADPRVFVNYNPPAGESTVIAEYSLDPNDSDRTDPSSKRILLEFTQPRSNHNGGMLAFGSDRRLYIGVGDGGGSGDPDNQGQTADTLLGKILRIDVEAAEGLEYGIPADNPFVGVAGYREEIWAMGLRNPWRFSFDLATDELYAGDVGQDSWEEIDMILAGANYGWNQMEGNHCFTPPDVCDESAAPNQVNSQGFTAPIHEYDHASGASITGGYVYRSCEVPAWQGIYVYGDLLGPVNGLRWDGTAVSEAAELVAIPALERITSFGSNAWGEVFMTALVSDGFEYTDGKIYRLAPG